MAGAVVSPDLAEEIALGGAHAAICGVDEAGRGPLAGPVVAAAVVLDRAALPEGIDDSKRLAAPRRAALFELILAGASVGVGLATVEEIERLNILNAAELAMRRAVEALPGPPGAALIDGNRVPPGLPCRARAIVGGDARSLSVAAASIVAKVTRDRLMDRLAERHPGYGWERNRGYGTPEHLAALSALGVTPEHRRGFAPVHNILRAKHKILS
ncbi:MAG TPA: ribonuclease HII [Thermohalobaculum sp.]|nr:ribonuclease HII [Thermohalobaculum sp.]